VKTALKHVYEPWGAAKELFASRAPEVLLSGPAGTGKSRACLEKLHAMMLMNPGARGLIVRKTRESLTSTGLVTYREHVAKESLEVGDVEYYGGSTEEPPQYRYRNGSKVMVGGMDKATKIMSSEYDVVYVQEAIELTLDDWEAITTRLRNGKISFQQVIADTNPTIPTHWLKQRCDRGSTVMLHSRHEDNPTLFQDGVLTERGRAYIGALDALTGVRKERLRYGRWVAAEGLVYEEYDPAVHLKDPMTDPPWDWPRWWVIDFGYRNPFVCQWWVQDPDGRLILYRELYQTGLLVEEAAKKILAAMKTKRGVEPWPRAIITDHDLEDRRTLEKHLGRGTKAARKTLSTGIEAVKKRLQTGTDGTPGLYVCRNALLERDRSLEDDKKPCSTEEEFVGYVWDTSGTKGVKEVPLKENDHGMDCVRYLCAELTTRSLPRLRYL
jgi:phage terminase large subunit